MGLSLLRWPRRKSGEKGAKQLSSIDILARDRLTVGIGVGYVEPELAATGISLAACEGQRWPGRDRKPSSALIPAGPAVSARY